MESDLMPVELPWEEAPMPEEDGMYLVACVPKLSGMKYLGLGVVHLRDGKLHSVPGEWAVPMESVRKWIYLPRIPDGSNPWQNGPPPWEGWFEIKCEEDKTDFIRVAKTDEGVLECVYPAYFRGVGLATLCIQHRQAESRGPRGPGTKW